VVALGFIAAFWLLILVLLIYCRPNSASRLLRLKKRLRDYAAMKAPHCTCCADCRRRLPRAHKQLLCAAEHEILLGILKKVEAKNGVMAAIWALFFGSITASVFGGAAGLGRDADAIALAQSGALFIVAGVPFIIASISGTRQIDNFSRLKWPIVNKSSSSARILQAQLLEDAILKEEFLWISRRGAIIFALAVPLLAALYLWNM
jgi:hypothetical protein